VSTKLHAFGVVTADSHAYKVSLCMKDQPHKSLAANRMYFRAVHMIKWHATPILAGIKYHTSMTDKNVICHPQYFGTLYNLLLSPLESTGRCQVVDRLSVIWPGPSYTLGFESLFLFQIAVRFKYLFMLCICQHDFRL
jgi:hypothetical protein